MTVFSTKTPFARMQQIQRAYVSRGGSLRDLESVPGAIPGPPGRLGSWSAVVEPAGAWERDRSFLSPAVWHTDGSLTAEPRLPGFPAGPENQSPGLVRISCCFRQLLHTQITWNRREKLLSSNLMICGHDIHTDQDLDMVNSLLRRLKNILSDDVGICQTGNGNSALPKELHRCQ